MQGERGEGALPSPTDARPPSLPHPSRGFYFKPVNVTRVGGQHLYAGCASCAADFGCLPGVGCNAANGCACPRGLYRRNGVCVTCQEAAGPGCRECSSDGTCEDCPAWNNRKAAQQAAAASDGPQLSEAYYDGSGLCQLCLLPGCARCAQDGTCDACMKGFFKAEDTGEVRGAGPGDCP